MRAVLVFALVAACKGEPAPPTSSVVPAETKSLAAMIPTMDAAKVIAKKSPNEAYALETWCIDQADAITRVTTALARDGWTSVEVRGTAPKQAVAAIKGDIRFSARSGGADSRCAGMSIIATVMRLGTLDSR